MSLQDYSIEDLHQMATAELDQNAYAVAELNALYQRLRDEYIAVYRDLRERPGS